MIKDNLIDLDIDQLKLLKKIIKAYIPGKTVWAYGSRVKWKAQDRSDLDLAVFDCSDRQINNLKEALEESDLLISVDVLDWESIPEDFKVNIQKKYMILQESKDISKASSSGKKPAGWRTVKLGEVVAFHYGKSLPKRNRVSGGVPVYGSAGLIDWHNKALVQGRGIIIGRKGTIGSVHKSETPFFPIDTTFYISENSLKNCHSREGHKVPRGNLFNVGHKGTNNEQCFPFVPARQALPTDSVGVGLREGKRLGSEERPTNSSTTFVPADTAVIPAKPVIPILSGNPVEKQNVSQITNLDFLFYVLSNLGLDHLNTDSAVPGLNRDNAYAQEILLPPLPEQRAIAEVLSSLDDKIELLHRQNKTLESMAEVLFRNWFIDQAKPTWKKQPLSYFLDTIESGSRPKGGIDSKLKQGVPSIGAESINGIGSFDFSKTKYITDDFFEKMRRGQTQDYDVLIYKDGAYIGKKAMFGKGFPFKKMAINEHVFILRPNSKANPFFIYCALEPNELSKLNANSAQPGLNQQAMKSFEIISPPKEQINHFGLIVKEWVDKILFNSHQIRTLETLRNTLLPKLITGQVRVQCPH